MNTKPSSKLIEKRKGDVWFVYDGDCPICSMAAHALHIKKSVGSLYLVNAREDKEHPLLKEVTQRRLDLDKGMVLKYQDSYYHGEDALHMMALLGSSQGWFNRMNALLFRYKPFARFCYPLMRATRNALLRIKGVKKIRNLAIDPQEPLFTYVLAEKWDALPPVMQKHYAIRPFSNDAVRVEGHLDVTISPLVSIMAKLTGMLVAYSGKNVPVTVVFRSDKAGAFHFERIFHFPDKGDISFHSCMEWINGNELVEFMRFGIGWKLAYEWDGSKIILWHRGYVWRILGVMIPVPMAFIIGKGHAEEMPLSDDSFRMWTHTKHPLFGKTFGYSGIFKVTEVLCSQS